MTLLKVFFQFLKREIKLGFLSDQFSSLSFPTLKIYCKLSRTVCALQFAAYSFVETIVSKIRAWPSVAPVRMHFYQRACDTHRFTGFGDNEMRPRYCFFAFF